MLPIPLELPRRSVLELLHSTGRIIQAQDRYHRCDRDANYGKAPSRLPRRGVGVGAVLDPAARKLAW